MCLGAWCFVFCVLCLVFGFPDRVALNISPTHPPLITQTDMEFWRIFYLTSSTTYVRGLCVFLALVVVCFIQVSSWTLLYTLSLYVSLHHKHNEACYPCLSYWSLCCFRPRFFWRYVLRFVFLKVRNTKIQDVWEEIYSTTVVIAIWLIWFKSLDRRGVKILLVQCVLCSDLKQGV